MKLQASLCGLALLGVLLNGAAADAETTGQQMAEAAGHGLIGSPAPRLVVKSVDGDTIDLGNLYGKKAVYLKFWATWCVPCREQMPHFQHTYETAGPDLAVIAVNAGFNDSLEEILKYRKRLGITMPIVFDDDGRLGAAFKLRVTPQHIVIGRDGRIQYVGHLADERLDAALLAARAPPAEVRSVQDTGEHAAVAARHFSVGERVPETTVRTLDGHAFQFQRHGLQGPTVFVFLSPWCESYLATTRPAVSANCRTAREQVTALSHNLHLRWLGVASGLWATPKDLQEYRTKYNVGIPLTLDESGTLFREFGVSNTPTIIVADAQGSIVRRVESGEAGTLRQALRGL
jgi:peroxiredoxin